jgi:hypothetical protein
MEGRVGCDLMKGSRPEAGRGVIALTDKASDA